MVIAPKFRTVVTPISAALGEWLHFPESVLAPDPDDRTKLCKFLISSNDTRKAARAGRRQPAFELWSIVLGVPPPVPGVERRNKPEHADLTSLQHAHACFKGIKRPLAEDNDGEHVLAYVLRPHFFYEYDPNMVSVASKVPVPRDVVFVTYVRLTPGRQRGLIETKGAVTHWGFVEADPSSLRLPVDHASRYHVHLW
jgi:hypothetical protein